MKTAKTSKYVAKLESHNFAKVARLFVDLLRDVLWETLTKRILPNDLPEIVRQNKSTLELAGRLTEDQYRRICKPGGMNVSYEDFDISLLYILLRYLPLKPKVQGSFKSWGSDDYPDEKDIRETDDIERIRIKRNQLFAHGGKASLSKDEFEKVWTDMEAVVARFDRRLSTDFKSEMEVILKDGKFQEAYIEDFKKQKEYDLETRQLALEAIKEVAEAKKAAFKGLERITNVEQKPNGILQNMLDKTREKLEDLKSEKAFFHQTNVFNQARDLLLNKTRGYTVFLSGNPGEGKTTAGHMLLLEMQNRTKRCLILNEPGDVRFVSPDHVDIIFVDDIFGKVYYDDHLNGLWKRHYEELKMWKRTKKLSFIFTSRELILRECRSKLDREDFFDRDGFILLSSRKLNKEEKTKILLKQLNRNKGLKEAFPLKNDELAKCYKEFTSPFGFPLCCNVFSSSKVYLKQKSKFFSRPLKTLEAGINELWETDANKPLFIALAAVWMSNEKEESSELDSLHRRIQVQRTLSLSNFDTKKLDTVAANFNVYLAKVFSIYELLEKLNGVYLIHHKQSTWQPEGYAFSHEVIEEAFGRVLARIRPSIAVQYGSIEFLVNNTSTATTTGNDDETSSMNDRESLKISIAKSDFENLFQRLMKSLKNLDDEFVAVHHDAFEDSNFLNFFLEKLSGKNELEELILKKRGFAWGFTRTSFLKEALKQNVPKVELVSRILEAKLLDQIDDQRWVQEQKQSMFSAACRLGSYQLYKLLVQESVAITSDAFIRATCAGNRKIVEDLFQRVRLGQERSICDRCLALASQKGFVELAEFFVEKGRLAEGNENLEELKKEEIKGLPPEILRMDEHSQQLYKEALEAGKVKVYNIRLMIVGHLGVGKTTLTKRILCEEVAETPHVSTKGIEVHHRCCKIDLDTNEWIIEGEETDVLDNGQHLVNIVSEYVANKSKPLMDDINQEETDSIHHLTNIEQDLKRCLHEEGMDVSSITGAIPVYLHPNKELSKADVLITDTTNGKISIDDADEENSHGKQVSLDPYTFQSGQTDLNEIISIDDILSWENNAEKNNTTSHSDFNNFVTKCKTMTHSVKTFCYVTMLDFAGQFVFYTTHQAFMSWRTIYLLVTDMSKSLNDLLEGDTCSMNLNKNMECRIHDYVVYWLNSIHSHGIPTDTRQLCERNTQRETDNNDQTPEETEKCPPVILVATHSDKVPEGEKDKIKNEYFDGVRRILKDRPQRFLLKGSIAISNIGPDSDIKLLKKKIFELAKKQDYWGEEIPGRWLALEQKLMELKRRGVKIIEYSHLEEINNCSDVKIETPDELEVFLRFEHDLGNIVFYNTEKLRTKVVLDPEWLIAGVRILISPSLHVIEDHPEIHPQWYDFKDTGRLTKSLIERLWVEDENEDFHKSQDHLLHLMEKLSIIAKPVEKDGDVQDQKPYYWVPCVIYKSAPDHVKNPKTCEGMTRTSTLCFVSKTKFIHVGVFHRLVASFLSKFSPAEEDGEYRLYDGCCEFEVDNCHSLYVALNDYIIHATMFRYSSEGEDPDNGLCSDVRSFISSTLADITACITPNSEFDICVKCDRSSADSIKGLLRISDEEELRCKCSQPFHPVKVANLLKFWEQKMDPFEAAQIHSETSDITRHIETETILRRRALPHGKKYHVFFSYSNFDMPWVKKTVKILEKDHGFVCCEYDRDNTPGTSLLRFASDSITNAYKTVVVMTREAFQSDFVVHEFEMAIIQGFEERRKCVVPVLLDDCEIPRHLNILTYVDARDPKRRDIWWPKLLTELETQEPD